jgi:endonuclease/exonuclease/phosphatase family metal-dependent hydrolase
MRRLLAPLLLLILTLPAGAAELKVATWNLEWLTLRPAGDRLLPPDVNHRVPADFARLAAYAAMLNADVVALQEVDGPETAARILPPDRYSLYFTRDSVVQRVGIAIRRPIRFHSHPDVTGLIEGPPGTHALRSGADVTLDLPGGSLRVLAVHLKTGCRQDRLQRSRRPQCGVLRWQLGVLDSWVAARQEAGQAFVVLGDFNRWMDDGDAFWANLRRVAPLARATEGAYSPCWGGERFIDHIIAGGPAREWMQPGTLKVLVYREHGEGWKQRLSDHCPVSVELRVPG